jgi:hypothetical protein
VTGRLSAARPSNAVARRVIGRVAVVCLLTVLGGCSPSAPATPVSSEGVSPPAFVLGCLSIEQDECQFVAERVVGHLPQDRGMPFAIEIHLYGCPNDGPCPETLAVREGKVTVEYADAREPVSMTIVGPPRAPTLGEAPMGWSGLIEPTSPRVGGSGPFPFDLGHCGLSWQVDFDGSFWLPIGQVDGDASPVINAERGHITLLGPKLAHYRGDSGFTAQLARFPGPKHVWICD